jgi:hypothetical protein
LDGTGVEERLLKRMKRGAARQSFDSDHRAAVSFYAEYQARVHGPSIEKNRARPALPLRATLLRASEADVIAKLTAFLKTKDPGSKAKKQKQTTVFRDSKDDHRIATITEVKARDAILEEVRGKDVCEWKLGGKPVLLWAPTVHYGGIRADVSDDGFVLVDSEDEAAQPKGAGKARGTWTFDSGLAVVHWAGLAMRECKGHEANELKTLEAAVAKKSAVTLKPNDKEAGGGAAVLKIAPGTYRAETGGDKKARWLRFTKA